MRIPNEEPSFYIQRFGLALLAATMKRLALLIFTMLAAGCTTLGQPYTKPAPPPQGKALVHLMRTSVGDGNFWSTVFAINDTKIVSLYDKGYSTVYLDPGTYTFSAATGLSFDSLNFRMPIEAEREYFVEYRQVPTGYRHVRNVIRAVSPVAGKRLVEKFFYKDADAAYIPGPELHARGESQE